MSNQETTLPEKCCAKCGFLYAVTQYAIGSLGAFDPDLIRSPLFEIAPSGSEKTSEERTIVTSYLIKQFSETRRYREVYTTVTLSNIPHSQPLQESEFSDTKITPVYWNEVNSINCLWNVFPTQNVDSSTENIVSSLNLLRRDRSDCGKYFNYHPGFSAKEHAEIRLQEQSDKQQQEFQERQNKLFLQLEETAANRDLYWKQKAEQAVQKEERDRRTALWINIISTSFAIIISIINLIMIAFRNP